jgi:hypothetical protein
MRKKEKKEKVKLENRFPVRLQFSEGYNEHVEKYHANNTRQYK